MSVSTDPTKGEVLAGESVYNNPDVIRALYTVLEATASKPVRQLAPYRNAGTPWTETEDDKLQDEFAEKMKFSDIAKEHGRINMAIERRLEHIGLKKKFWLFQIEIIKLGGLFCRSRPT